MLSVIRDKRSDDTYWPYRSDSSMKISFVLNVISCYWINFRVNKVTVRFNSHNFLTLTPFEILLKLFVGLNKFSWEQSGHFVWITVIVKLQFTRAAVHSPVGVNFDAVCTCVWQIVLTTLSRLRLISSHSNSTHTLNEKLTALISWRYDATRTCWKTRTSDARFACRDRCQPGLWFWK